jgi:hypothetical protein
MLTHDEASAWWAPVGLLSKSVDGLMINEIYCFVKRPRRLFEPW